MLGVHDEVGTLGRKTSEMTGAGYTRRQIPCVYMSYSYRAFDQTTVRVAEVHDTLDSVRCALQDAFYIEVVALQVACGALRVA